MELQEKPSQWGCLVTAFAMALDLSVEDLMKLIGHDGGRIVFADLPEPMRRRGFHYQECIEAALKVGRSATPIELFPAIAPSSGRHLPFQVRFEVEGNWERFKRHIHESVGVLEGRGRNCLHAVAYDHGRIYDPDGREYDFSREACEARHLYVFRLWRIDVRH